jgi:ParB/RepB/Spo0J family partition protein
VSEEQKTLLERVPVKIPKPHNEEIDLDALPKTLPGPDPSAEFVESVKRDGVIEPIVLLRADKKVKVLTGRRRIKAARAAGLAKIPARVFDLGDEDSAAFQHIHILLLNGMRSDNPITDLEAIESLLLMGAEDKEIAAATGLSVQTIRRRLRLGALHKVLRDALRKGKITIAAAEKAARLPYPTQETLAKTYDFDGALPVSVVEEALTVRASQIAFEITRALPLVSVDLATWARSAAEAIAKLADAGRLVGADAELVGETLALAAKIRTAPERVPAEETTAA